MQNIISRLLYGLSIAAAAVGLYMYFTLNKLEMLQYDDYAEVTGSIVMILVLFQLMLFVCLFFIKRDIMKPMFNSIAKVLRQYHKPVGLSIIGFLTLHYCINAGLLVKYTDESTSGFVTGVIVMMFVISGALGIKGNKQTMKFHRILPYVIIVPLILHIIL